MAALDILEMCRQRTMATIVNQACAKNFTAQLDNNTVGQEAQSMCGRRRYATFPLALVAEHFACNLTRRHFFEATVQRRWKSLLQLLTGADAHRNNHGMQDL